MPHSNDDESMARLAEAITPAPQPDGEPVTLTYTNWRGETAQRTITPKRIWWGATDWHPEPQWLLTAFDDEKQAERDFALKDFGAATPQPAGEAVLREIIDWCHLQPGNYPNWMDRARQAVGDFEGDPGQPPQPSETVAESPDQYRREGADVMRAACVRAVNATASPIVGTPYSAGGKAFADAIRAIDVDDVLARLPPAPDAVARLVEAARAGLNYLENTEGEFGITLGSATGLRAALAAMEDSSCPAAGGAESV